MYSAEGYEIHAPLLCQTVLLFKYHVQFAFVSEV
jgi:hypothetical protein